MTDYNLDHKTHIMRLVNAGHIIRVMDGRCDDGFVGINALNELIKEGILEVFRDGTMDFARLANKADTIHIPAIEFTGVGDQIGTFFKTKEGTK